MTDSPIRRLIDRSSLGTPDAVQLRDSVSDESARKIVERSGQITSVDDLPGPDEWPELAEFLRRSVAAAHTHTYAEPDDIERLRTRIIPPVTDLGDATTG